MNKNLIIGLVLTILIGGGLFLIKSQSDKNTDAALEPEVIEKSASIDKKEFPQNSKDSSGYIVYSSEVLEKSKNNKRVLFFYASWCPTCRIADPELSANANKFPEDLVVLRVNYNDPDTDQEERDLAKKYAVTYQHTFVQIDGEGNEVATWNGGGTEDLLANLL